jgi:hypothetical protein
MRRQFLDNDDNNDDNETGIWRVPFNDNELNILSAPCLHPECLVHNTERSEGCNTRELRSTWYWCRTTNLRWFIITVDERDEENALLLLEQDDRRDELTAAFLEERVRRRETLSADRSNFLRRRAPRNRRSAPTDDPSFPNWINNTERWCVVNFNISEEVAQNEDFCREVVSLFGRIHQTAKEQHQVVFDFEHLPHCVPAPAPVNLPPEMVSNAPIPVREIPTTPFNWRKKGWGDGYFGDIDRMNAELLKNAAVYL